MWYIISFLVKMRETEGEGVERKGETEKAREECWENHESEINEANLVLQACKMIHSFYSVNIQYCCVCMYSHTYVVLVYIPIHKYI